MGGNSSQTLTRRLGHSKSRGGCRTCKKRKVKCDEEKPVCGNCSTYFVSIDRCDYDWQSQRKFSSPRKTQSQYIWHNTFAPLGMTKCVPNVHDELGVLDMRLIHTYTAITSTLPDDNKDQMDLSNFSSSYSWKEYFPQQAFNNRLVLRAMLAISALYLRTFRPEVPLAQRNTPELYFGRAIKEHRLALLNLPHKEEEAEALIVSGALIIHYSWCCYNHLDQDTGSRNLLIPKLPFLTWHLAQGIHRLSITQKHRLSLVARELFWKPNLKVERWPQSIESSCWFLQSGQEDLNRLLACIKSDARISDSDLEVYQHCSRTISDLYKFSIALTPGQQQAFYELIFFTPIWEPPRFLELLHQGVAPALALLARIWCLLAFVKNVWWCTSDDHHRITAECLRQIQEILPDEWTWSVEWPLSVLRNICPSVVPMSAHGPVGEDKLS